MLRISLLICFTYCLVHVDAQIERDFIGEIFAEDVDIQSNSTIMACPRIVGKEKGCYSCDHCDSEAATKLIRENKRQVFKLKLNDGQCSAREICCTSQTSNTFRSGGENCGQSNPEGHPRAERSSLRSVLPGEYPWRAWVYSKLVLNKPLCAATLINIVPGVLMTSAYCVHQYQRESLVVKFTKDKDSNRFNFVKEVIIKKYFNDKTRYSDIALIVLDGGFPTWTKPVCRSEDVVSFGESCIGVSSDDNYMHATVPQQKLCKSDDSKNKLDLDPSFICTVSPRGDHIPEFGGALICPEQAETKMHYTAYGITLYQSKDSSITVHTNVTFFNNWIQDNLNKLTPLYTDS